MEGHKPTCKGERERGADRPIKARVQDPLEAILDQVHLGSNSLWLEYSLARVLRTLSPLIFLGSSGICQTRKKRSCVTRDCRIGVGLTSSSRKVGSFVRVVALVCFPQDARTVKKHAMHWGHRRIPAVKKSSHNAMLKK